MQVTEGKTGSLSVLVSCSWVSPGSFFLPLTLSPLHTVTPGDSQGTFVSSFIPVPFLESEPQEASASIPSIFTLASGIFHMDALITLVSLTHLKPWLHPEHVSLYFHSNVAVNFRRVLPSSLSPYSYVCHPTELLTVFVLCLVN